MRFVFASYIVTPSYKTPEAWINRIRAYSGIQEALGKNHEIISIEQIDYEGEYVKDDVTYQFKRFPKDARFPLQQHRFIKSLKPDVVIIQSLHFPLQVIQLRLLLGSRVKIIIQNHAEKPFTGLKKQVQRLADHYTSAYLFASKAMGIDWISKGNLLSPAKIHEVMEVSSVFHPINKELALAQTGITGRPIYLWVGRLNQNKDPLNVIKGFLKFADINPTARLYMIYHTDELLPEIKALLKNEPNATSIILIGSVPNDDLLYWFNSADFIVSGSHYEGSGTSICEAMSCGCVPVVTDIFSFRMITDNGACGILFEPGNEGAFLSALKQTQQLDMPAQREKALAYFNANLSFNAIAKKIQDIAASC
jgi:glycosyltransferase involved in cell wall biosynthesis